MGMSRALLAASLLAGAAYFTYEDYWRPERDPTSNAINGIDWGRDLFVPNDFDENLLADLATLNTQADLAEQLAAQARQEPWCSTNTISDAAGISHQVCIDEDNLMINASNRIIAFMRTEPRVEQTDGSLSLFLTYQQPANVATCVAGKEQMRSQMVEDLETIIGQYVAGYAIEIHVDPRNLTHPCDDAPAYVN